jgi:hypothetical protein
MKTQRLVLCLTMVNFIALAYVAFRTIPVGSAEVAPLVRTHALEIVDDDGRVRAMIRVFPAQPTLKMPDGTTGYPETVLLRLIDSKGGPNVKIAATEDGAAMSLVGEGNPTQVQLMARGANPSVKLVNKDGQEQKISIEN